MSNEFAKIDTTEFDKAEAMLKERGIGYTREDDIRELPGGFGSYERHQIVLLDEFGNTIGDFVCSHGTYGADKGLLEYWGKDHNQDPEGWLTAEEVVEKIEAGI